MSKILLIVEGIADVIFFRDYLCFFQNDLCLLNDSLTNKKNQFICLKSNSFEIKVLISGGYHRIVDKKTTIEEHVDFGYKILVIQDADNNKKDTKAGGLDLRLKYLEKIKNEHNIDFEIFLFPNHQDDGDLETLLLRITQNDKYNPFDNCHTGYINCLEKILKIQTIKDFRKEKNYIYTYLSLYEGHHVAKERDREYVPEYWDFDSTALMPLKSFFEKHLFFE